MEVNRFLYLHFHVAYLWIGLWQGCPISKRVSATSIKATASSQLVLDLDSPVFATRQRATEELTKLDRLAEPVLRKALDGQPSLKMRRRVQELLGQLAAAPTGEHLRQMRAVEALEDIGAADAQAVLKTLTNGAPDARLTREAKGSLERLEKRRAVQR